ncbi:MAG: HIT domain-containing protein [Deltaproteobacteria bacterium]|nr:HIT domain-containing protein [Deltaproteobacteria bacterium]
MTDTIWAPWRMEFIDGSLEKETGCIFCNRFSSSESEFAAKHVLWRGPQTLVMLNKFPYTNAHLLVVSRTHTGNLEDISPEEFSVLIRTVKKASEIIKEELNPHGMNIGMNLGSAGGAGITDHLHWHIVPRWVGDNNFMPVIGDTRVMPQYLEKTYNRLIVPFQKMNQSSVD